MATKKAAAKKTAAKKSAAKKTAAKKTAAKKSAAKKTPAKKSAKKTAAKKKPSSAQHCWPGFEPVPGKDAGEKGSCKPKKTQTKKEKKGDQKAAAATKGKK